MSITQNGGSSEARRKRLFFRARRRGFKEADLIFGAFAATHLDSLDESGLDAFEALLRAPDQQVYAWLQGAPVPAEFDTPVFAAMKAFCDRKDPAWSV
jgi:antitoxin CptB